MTLGSKLVFLSYAHPDESAATAVYRHLLAAGFDPWLDRVSLKPGTEWRDEIGRAIRRGGAFLSLISPASVDRGGVLSGEMKLALDLRAERLDSGGILIPVRLEPCDLPQELNHIQALDWFAPDGPAKLTAALASLLKRPSVIARIQNQTGRPWALAAMGVICFAAGTWAYQGLSRISRLRTYESFRQTRPDSPVPPVTNGSRQIGVTVWRVSQDNEAGAGACGYLRFSRQPITQPVHTGDRLRLDVQASQPGYVYVISQEIDAGGRTGAPRLLFPVTAANGQRANAIAPGSALLIPPASDECRTLQLTHSGEGEQVSVLLSDKVIDALPARDGPYVLDPLLVERIETSATRSNQVESPQSPGSRDVMLPDSESRDLSYTSAGPDEVFTSSDHHAELVIAKFVLKTQQ